MSRKTQNTIIRVVYLPLPKIRSSFIVEKLPRLSFFNPFSILVGFSFQGPNVFPMRFLISMVNKNKLVCYELVVTYSLE